MWRLPSHSIIPRSPTISVRVLTTNGVGLPNAWESGTMVGQGFCSWESARAVVGGRGGLCPSHCGPRHPAWGQVVECRFIEHGGMMKGLGEALELYTARMMSSREQ